MQRTATHPQIAYTLEGAQGPRVVLIMGLGMPATLWRPQVDALAPDHQVLSLDNRGVGNSESANDRTTMAAMANDVLRTMDAANFADAHVVGVSMGGMIAQEVVLAAPTRVRSLTLIATHAGGIGGMLPAPSGMLWMALTALGTRASRAKAMSNMLFPREFQTAHPHAVGERITRQLGVKRDAKTPLRQMWAVANHNTHTRLSAVRTPTLIIKTGKDVLVRPSHSETLARRIPGARLVSYQDAGHGIVFQEAQRLADDLRAHFASAEIASTRDA
jgi:3-oxoadipate enol-lactonase